MSHINECKLVLSSDMKNWKLGVTITKLDNSQTIKKATRFKTQKMGRQTKNSLQKNGSAHELNWPPRF